MALVPADLRAEEKGTVVIFPFAGDGELSERFYGLASAELWRGRVVPRAVLAAEVKKLGFSAEEGRLTAKQVNAVARRLGAGIVIAGRKEPGGRLYVYVADLEARVAFVRRGYAGSSAGEKAFLDGMRQYAGLSAHERATLAQVRFKAASQARPGVTAPPLDTLATSSAAVSVSAGAAQPVDYNAELKKIQLDPSELDRITFEDFNLDEISTDLGL
ncbi:MAG: hypothetical protein ACYC2I_00640 [Elusimicrobiales bacterium]